MWLISIIILVVLGLYTLIIFTKLKASTIVTLPVVLLYRLLGIK